MHPLALALRQSTNKKEIPHRGYNNVVRHNHTYHPLSTTLCHKAVPRTSQTQEKHDDALLVGGSLARKTALCYREEGQEPPGVTQLQNPPGREGQRKGWFRHSGHTASSTASVLWTPLSKHPCEHWAPPPDVHANSGQHREAACHQLVQVLERLLFPAPSPSCHGDAQWHHSATELLLVSSAAQKTSMSRSEAESRAVTSDDLVVTQLYPSPGRSCVQDVVELLPHNTAQQYAGEILRIPSHGNTPLVKKTCPTPPTEGSSMVQGQAGALSSQGHSGAAHPCACTPRSRGSSALAQA